jgi:predicted site-specific integrase-resolvase
METETELNPKLITKKEVCNLLSVCSETVERFHRDGLLPKVKLTSRTIRYDMKDVNRLIERRTLI